MPNLREEFNNNKLAFTFFLLAHLIIIISLPFFWLLLLLATMPSATTSCNVRVCGCAMMESSAGIFSAHLLLVSAAQTMVLASQEILPKLLGHLQGEHVELAGLHLGHDAEAVRGLVNFGHQLVL